MKKRFLSTGYLVRLMLLCGLFFSSCVNTISEDDPVEKGEVPIFLSTHASGNTELAQQGFREGDAIGLYGMIHPHTLSDARYLDNVKLTCDASLNFIPEKEIFFPKGEDQCELVGYFPYRESGMEADKSKMGVYVQADQSTEEDFVISDFKIARTGYQLFNGSQIKLTFEHTGCLLKVKIVNASETSMELLSGGEIEATLHGFYRQALYDVEKKEFSDWDLPEVISPFGEWTKVEQHLTGKQAILIPQPFRRDDQYLLLRMDQKTHICPFPEGIKLESGKVCELTIHYKPEEREIGNVTCHTGEWTEGTSGDSHTQELTHPIYADDLPFDQSGICRIWYQGRVVAEVCKEWIRCEGIEAQAIVVYPVVADETDLTQGKVLHLLGVSRPVHGGTLSWDLSVDRCTYTPGTRLAVSYFFIDYDGSIVLSSPKEAQPVEVKPLLFTDNRSNEAVEYPIVKIGTQYWMQDNLKANRYNDGGQIAKKTDLSTPEAGYGIGSSVHYFYNQAAVKTGKLCPEGWKLPGTADWTQLLEYLEWNASLMKNGPWRDELYPVTNLSGFNGCSFGIFLTTYKYPGDTVGYWSTGETETEIPEYSYFLMHDNEKVQKGLNRSEKGLSVRCIRR